MYRIMTLVKEGRDRYSSLYKFLTYEDDYGETVFYEAKDDKELDAKVEEMLNGRYAKKDFVVVQVKDYNIDVDIVANEPETDSTTP